MLISLTPEHRGSTFDCMKAIRKEVYPQFPEMTFFFQSADIVSQTLNFGLQSPIDLQVVGNNRAANFEIARRLVDRLRAEPGLVDVRLHQVVAAPQLRVEVDRTRAAQLGMTQRDVTNNLLVSLASSSDAAPNFWLNPQNGVSYRVSVQTPQYRRTSSTSTPTCRTATSAGPRATSAGSWRAWRRSCRAAPLWPCAARCRTWTPPSKDWPAASSSRSSWSTA